jgi:hypothetical protein
VRREVITYELNGCAVRDVCALIEWSAMPQTYQKQGQPGVPAQLPSSIRSRVLLLKLPMLKCACPCPAHTRGQALPCNAQPGSQPNRHSSDYTYTGNQRVFDMKSPYTEEMLVEGNALPQI